MEKRTAGHQDMSEEFSLRLKAKYGMEFPKYQSDQIVVEVLNIIKDFVLSERFEKINIVDLGFFFIKHKPAREVYKNLPNSNNKGTFKLPERKSIHFKGTKGATEYINTDKETN